MHVASVSANPYDEADSSSMQRRILSVGSLGASSSKEGHLRKMLNGAHRAVARRNRTKAKHFGTSGGTSWIEEPSHRDRLLVLRNVCLDQHRLIFFRNATAAALFDRIKDPYRVWQSIAKPRAAAPEWVFEVANQDGGMSAERWINDTSFLYMPHRAVDNVFHFHNNFLLPLMLNVMLSDSDHAPRRVFLFKTWPLVSNGVRADKHGKWPHEATHPALFYVLHKLFSEVVWPVDDLWASGERLCFRRFVWSQKLTPLSLPYYDHLTSDRLYRMVGVMPRVRDLVRSALAVAALPAFRAANSPSVLWISRQPTCHAKVRTVASTSEGRCIENLDQVLNGLRQSRLFGSVRVMDDFKLRHDAKERDMYLREQLEMLRDTDIMIGMHGAGLTNVLYLSERAALVELKGYFWFGEGFSLRIYQSMARLQGCGYMSVDIRPAMGGSRLPNGTGYTLAKRHVTAIATFARHGWQQAQNLSHAPMMGYCCGEKRTKVSCRCPYIILKRSDKGSSY